MASIEMLVRERILVLDGAMGTMIQQYNLTEEDFRGERFAQIPGQLKGNNDILCLTRPDVIQDIHRKYLVAGADIIETNTFSSTSVSMADYHVQEYVREINLAAVRLAREVADEFTALTPDKPRFVAGSIGPTNKTCSMSPDVNNPAFRALTYDELAAAYREQIEAMLEAGVDDICCRAGDGGYRRPGTVNAFRNGFRHRRTYFVRTDAGSISGFGAACGYFFCRA